MPGLSLPAAVLLATAGVLAVADWVAVVRGDRRVEYVCKPATIVALLGVALALDADDPGARPWVLAALVFSLAGDVFLMLKERDLFVPGLASFLVAHLAYVAAFRGEASWTPAALVVVPVALVVGLPVLRALAAEPGLRPLLGPVVAYMAVLALMVAVAVATRDPLAVTGAWLFLASDSLIAWSRFVRPLAWAPVAIIVTYHVAQAGLVLSLAT